MPSCEESLDESNIRNETSKNNFDSFREANIGNDTFVSNMNNETSSDNFPNGDSQHSTTNDLSGHSRSFSAKEKEKSLDRERDEENFETIAKVSDKLECENKDLLKVEFSTKTKIKILDEPQWMFCSIPGCGFWTRKPERMTRHKLCHLDEVKLSFQCPGEHTSFAIIFLFYGTLTRNHFFLKLGFISQQLLSIQPPFFCKI